VITLYPVRSTLADVVKALRRMPKPSRVEKRQAIRMPQRRRNG
jgi:hypothetical protein